MNVKGSRKKAAKDDSESSADSELGKEGSDAELVQNFSKIQKSKDTRQETKQGKLKKDDVDSDSSVYSDDNDDEESEEDEESGDEEDNIEEESGDNVEEELDDDESEEDDDNESNDDRESDSNITPATFIKKKCHNFLSTLIKLAGDETAISANITKLIQNLIDNKIKPEGFSTQLQNELGSNRQPYMIQFLKQSLPYVRKALISGEMTIKGIRPPSSPASGTTTAGLTLTPPIDVKNDSEENESNNEELDPNAVGNKMFEDFNKEMNKESFTKQSNITDEYAEGDTSDEEDIRNTVGNIPMKWYDDMPHIGYDIEGKKIMKPATSDEIDEFLNKIDDPNYWRTVKNKMTGEKVVLTDEDLDIIQRIQSGKFPTNAVQYEPFEDFFTYKKMEHPVTNFPPHKRSFVPSKIEKEKVSKLVHAIKMGWIKPRVSREEKEKFYNLWESDVAEESKRMRNYIPAPKRKLPGHEESYNPPPEYLFDKEEEEKWKEQEPDERKIDFIPKKYSCLRKVPAYSNFIREAFERCLDLYLCPRQRKMRVNVDPNDLLPQLPKPKDLQPFPTTLAIVFKGHSELVRCITVDPSGQFLASGSDDHTVKIWEVLTGRCLRTINVGGPVRSLTWCPSEVLSLILVAVNNDVFVINTKVGDKVVISNTDLVLSSLPENPEDKIVTWSVPSEEQKEIGFRLIITHSHPIKQVVWHAKGDYFATLSTDCSFRAISIHQLSKFRSQVPFKKLGSVQCIMFHPLRPFFFLATQTHVKMYNLIKQELSKKLIGNCKMISNIAIHPQGDNLIVGGYDCKVNWFDLELSKKPYKTFRHHKKAVRQVAFHKRYPLFASTSDDGNVIISHGMVYSDLLQNPTIQFVKALKGHELSLDCYFHPQRPWIFSASGDTIRLYS